MATSKRIRGIIEGMAAEAKSGFIRIQRSDIEAGLRAVVQIEALLFLDSMPTEFMRQTAFTLDQLLNEMEVRGDVTYIGQVEEEARASAEAKDA